MSDLSAIYQAYVQTLNERRFADLGEFVHATVRRNGVARTIGEYADGIAANVAAVPDLRWDLQETVVAGDVLVARLVDTGTVRAPWRGLPVGSSFTATELAQYRFRDGRFHEIWVALDVQRVPDGRMTVDERRE